MGYAVRMKGQPRKATLASVFRVSSPDGGVRFYHVTKGWRKVA